MDTEDRALHTMAYYSVLMIDATLVEAQSDSDNGKNKTSKTGVDRRFHVRQGLALPGFGTPKGRHPNSI